MVGAERARDSEAAVALNVIMARISESCWCASWVPDLEFSLWSMLQGGPRQFGMGDVSDAELDALRRLSDRAGGWWRWSEQECVEVFVSFEEWRAICDAQGSRHPGPGRPALSPKAE